jgi:uncharacterized protein YjdB
MIKRVNRADSVIMALILLMSLFLDFRQALAVSVKPTTATIMLTVVSEKKVAGMAVGVTGLDISLQDAAGYDLVPNTDFTRGPDAAGIYKISGLSTGTYSLTVAHNGYKESIKVSITALGEKKVSMTYIDGSNPTSLDRTKVGAIGGIIFDQITGNPVASPVIVRAVGPTSTYEVMTDNTIQGQFKFYVPPGKYYLVTERTNDGYKNTISAPINVIVGQTVTPALDSDLMVNTVQWPSGGTDKQLGLTVPTILPNAKSFRGYANVGTTVTAIVYSDTLQRYTFLASAVAKGSTSGGLGTYTLTLPTVQPNKKIKVIVTDPAFDSYTDLTNDTTPTAKLSTSALTNDPNASIAVDMKLGFKDATSTFLSSVTSVVYNTIDDGQHDFPLIKDTQYSTTKNTGKLTIIAGSIPIGTNYNIKVTAKDFEDTEWTGVVVKTSSTVPPKIPGTLTWSAGSALGATHLKWVPPTAAAQQMSTNHKLMYTISTNDLSVAAAGSSQVFLANTLTNATDYNSSTDIADVLPNQWFGVYEVDKTSLQIFKFTSHKLAVAEIKGPAVDSTVLQTVYGYNITLNFNAPLNQAKVPPITSFTAKVTPLGGTAANRSLSGGVVINNQTITLTLSGAPIKSTDKVTIAYTPPSTNYLQDSSGLKVASIPSATPLALQCISGEPITGLTGPLQLGRTTTAQAITVEPGAGAWTSSNPTVATVDANTGIVTALTSGNTIISYTSSTNNRFNSQAVTVYAATITPDFTIGDVQIGEGNVTPTGFIAPGTNETIVWTSSNPTQATVNSTTGVITPISASISAGDTTISYTVMNSINLTIRATGSKQITVFSAAPIINPIFSVAQVGEGTVIPAGYIIPNSGQAITWTSSAASNASIVATTGELTPLMAGSSTVSYKITDISTQEVMYKGSQNVTIYSAATSRNPIIGIVQVGENSVTPSAITVPSGYSIEWTSSNPDLATVDSVTGTITPLNAGTTTISYAVTNNQTSLILTKGSQAITIGAAAAAGANPIIGTTEVGKGNVLPTGYTIPSAGQQSITWYSDDPTIATVVPATGLITPVRTGSTTIRYKVTDNTTHFVVYSGSTIINVGALNLSNVGVDVAHGLITGTTSAMQYSLTGLNGPWIAASAQNTSVQFVSGDDVWVRQATDITNEVNLITI